MARKVLLLFMLLTQVKIVENCKKVIVIPGMLEPDFMIQPLVDTINERQACSKAEVFSHGNIFKTLYTLQYQTDELKSRFKDIMQQNPDGIHVIGESLGGILARNLIQTATDHNVNTLITLASPHNGIFDIPMLLPYYIPSAISSFSRKILTKIFYTSFGQKYVTFASGWKNPQDYDNYLENNNCLPLFNNEKQHPNFEHFRNSFLKLKKFVMTTGEKDRFVIPWESSLFSYYDENFNIVNMTSQKIYETDSLGLRTLNEAGRIKLCPVPNADHMDLKHNSWAIENCILPYLT